MASTIEGAAGALGSSPGLLGAFRAAFGGNSSRMAAALAGTSDKKSSAYKTAQRNVQRYYTKGKEQRKPSPKARAKMAKFVPTKARVRGKFYFDTPGFRSSPDTRERDISFDISAADMAAIQSAGSPEQARELFFDAYGMTAPDEIIGADYSFEV